MRKVFSSNELSETVLVRDALVHHGVDATIHNEHSGTSAIPAFRPPAEVWIKNAGDFASARRIVADAIATLDSKSNQAPWVCPACEEENPQSFDLCWSCQREREPRHSA